MSSLLKALPRGIYSTAQVRGFDRHAIDELGIEGFELMRRAGQAALDFLRAGWPEARSLVIYCGAGNNGGDGYVLAALAAAAGLEARVVAVIDPATLTGDAARALGLAREAGIGIAGFAEAGAAEPTGATGAAAAGSADDRVVLVDALLGTGLTRDVDGALAEAVARLNAATGPVLALDVPTGLDSDTGAIRGVAVEADATITFVGQKSGLYLGAGPGCRGRLGFAALGLPDAVYRTARPVLRRLDPADLGLILKRRSRMSHKGLNGRVLIVGGQPGMAGAARLAAEAALRSGAGLVHAAVAPESVAAVMAGRPEIMCRGVTRPADFDDWTEAADVVVVGPGLGRAAWGTELAEAMFSSDRPLVVDADALNHLAANRSGRGNWVLTPHPGEAGRLLGSSAGAVQLARDEAAAALARDYRAIVVLKGACSLVARPAPGGARNERIAEDGETAAVAVCDYGNPGMATGGMGDVLSGVIGGLGAELGLSAATVETAVLAHALAGDDAAEDGERGLVASDLFVHLRRRVNPV